MSTPRRLLMPVLATFALTALAPASASAGGGCRGENLAPTTSNISTIKSATRCLINKERRSRGRRSLRAQRHLTGAAQRYSAQMVRQGFFAHVCPEGSTMTSRIRSTTRYLAKASGYSLGENLAWGAGSRATPRAIVRSWMRSPGHRANILDRGFRQLGVGVAIGAPSDAGGQRAATYATEFGSRS